MSSAPPPKADIAGLNQPLPLHAGMPVLADNDMVVHRDSQRRGDVDDRAGHLDVRLRRRGIPEEWLCINILEGRISFGSKPLVIS